jgi:micrococcal nuclease
VEFVADGDTLRIRLADRSVMVRLLGVNTPEKESKYREREPWGERVAVLARERWMSKQVELVADLAKTDQYDRVLGYVALDGADQGAWLLREGYARVFVPAPHPRRAAYWRLQQQAQAAKAGLWGTPPPAQAAGGVIGNTRSRVVHAPGCKYLPAPRNRAAFASRAAAEAAGYRAHDCLRK